MSERPALPAAPQLVPVDLAASGNEDLRAFDLLAEGWRTGIPGALLTLVEIIGGAPRPLGTHMAVLSDGRYCGYVSGNCAEAAISREAMAMIERNHGGLIRVGKGSAWLDIRLPCGGGLVLDVLVQPNPFFVASVRAALNERRHLSVALGARPVVDLTLHPTGFMDGVFHRAYRPEPRLLLFGGGREAVALLRLGRAAGLDVHLHTPDLESLAIARSVGAGASHCRTLSGDLPVTIDRWTAIVFLDHDHEREFPFLAPALTSAAFYVGALGSARTHSRRRARLAEDGLGQLEIDRIHAPIGLVAHARDSRTLAISILAEIAAEAQRL